MLPNHQKFARAFLLAWPALATASHLPPYYYGPERCQPGPGTVTITSYVRPACCEFATTLPVEPGCATTVIDFVNPWIPAITTDDGRSSDLGGPTSTEPASSTSEGPSSTLEGPSSTNPGPTTTSSTSEPASSTSTGGNELLPGIGGPSDTTTTSEAQSTPGITTTTTTESTTSTSSTSSEEPSDTGLPPPDQSCGNRGLAYAVQDHAFTTNPTFDPVFFQTQTPTHVGTTDRVGVPLGSPYATPFSPYADTPPQIWGTTKALNHWGFLFAAIDGDYIIKAPSTDDITFVWVGVKALNTWTRANADLTQNYVTPESGPAPVEETVTLVAGTYNPIRILAGNIGGAFNFDLSITAPNGEVIMDGTTSNGDFLVQRACDDSTPTFTTPGPVS